MAILEYRRNEEMAHISAEIRSENEGLKNVALATHAENRVVKKLTDKMQRDTNFMKILTFIALLYLPANLISVSAPLIIFIRNCIRHILTFRGSRFSAQALSISIALL
jgi:hypothetical protein